MKKALLIIMAVLAFGISQEAAAQVVVKVGKVHRHHNHRACVKVKKRQPVCRVKAGHRWVAGHYKMNRGVRIWVPGVWVRI